MIERDGTIVNSLGMHARPAAQVVRLASGFKASIELEHDGQVVNGKSIMGVMTPRAECDRRCASVPTVPTQKRLSKRWSL